MVNRVLKSYAFKGRKILYGSNVNIYKKKGASGEYFKYKGRYYLLKHYKKVKVLKRGLGSVRRVRRGGCGCGQYGGQRAGQHGDCIVCLNNLKEDAISVCPQNVCTAKVCSEECKNNLRRFHRRCPQCRAEANASSNSPRASRQPRQPTEFHMRLAARGVARRAEEAQNARNEAVRAASRTASRGTTRASARPFTARTTTRPYDSASALDFEIQNIRRAREAAARTREPAARTRTTTRPHDSVSALDLEIQNIQRARRATRATRVAGVAGVARAGLY